MIDIDKVIILENEEEYLVLDKVNYENIEYYYIAKLNESRTDIGCINPESYVKTSSGSYFFDKIGGRIVFDSQSGLQDISTGFINELIKDKQTIQSAYIGAPYYEVWFYLGNEIVVWSERDKKWIYRVDVSGIEHITNSDIILTCKDGIWVHDSSVRKLYNISINNKVSIQVSPVVRSTAKTLAVVASDSVDITLSDSGRLTNTPHGLAKPSKDKYGRPLEWNIDCGTFTVTVKWNYQHSNSSNWTKGKDTIIVKNK